MPRRPAGGSAGHPASLPLSDQYRFNQAELLAGLKLAPEDLQRRPAGRGSHPRLVEALRGGGIATPEEAPGRGPQHLVDSVRLPVELDRGYLLRLMLARESLGSTGVGEGLAIPQLVYPNALEPAAPVVTLAFLEHPVDFEALDGRPVECLLGLISPSLRGHYFLLDRIHYALRDAGVRQALAERHSRDRILAELSRVEAGLREALS